MGAPREQAAGGGAPMALGGGERVGEHRWKVRKGSVASIWAEEGWRWWFRGEVGAAAVAMACSGTRGAGASSIRLGDGKGVEKEVGNVRCASSTGRRGPRAQGDGEGAHGTTRRRRGASRGRPRRACRETAPRGGVEKCRGGSGSEESSLAGEGGAWPAARRRRTARRRRCDREGDDGEGSSVNNAKFQSPVRKLSFSPSSWLQMKNF